MKRQGDHGPARSCASWSARRAPVSQTIADVAVQGVDREAGDAGRYPPACELLGQDAELRCLRLASAARLSAAGRPLSHEAPARGFTRIPTLTCVPGARRPHRSSCERRSRFTWTPVSTSASTSDADRFVPVKLISSTDQPFASACRTSPGEHASIPTEPRAPTNASTSGSRWALSASRSRKDWPARSNASTRPRACSSTGGRSVREDGRAVVPRDRLGVTAVNRAAGRRGSRAPVGSTTVPCRGPMLAFGRSAEALRLGPGGPAALPRVSRRGVGRAGPRRPPPVRDADARGRAGGALVVDVLDKREGYRRAFAGFDLRKVARFTPAKVARLLRTRGSCATGEDRRDDRQARASSTSKEEHGSSTRTCGAS